MKRKQTAKCFSFSNTPLTKTKLVILALGFNMTFLVGFKGPPVHKIYLEVLPVRNLKKLRTTVLHHDLCIIAILFLNVDIFVCCKSQLQKHCVGRGVKHVPVCFVFQIFVGHLTDFS